MVYMINSLIKWLFLLIQINQIYTFYRQSFESRNGIDEKVVNGYTGDHDKYPFAVFLNQSELAFCGGSIVNNQWIITAAHCLMDDDGTIRKPNSLDVNVGKKSIHDENGATYKVSELFVHPKYDPKKFPLFDVALIKLQDSIQFTDTVQPICLDYSENEYPFLITAGYGSTTVQIEYPNGTKTNSKSGVDFKWMIAREDRNAFFCSERMRTVCFEPYFDNAENTDSVCFGDSGGSIFNVEPRAILGVLSSVTVDEDEKTGNRVFCKGHMTAARLSRHQNFIDSLIGENNYCAVRQQSST